jgi:hypothetical protein
VRLSISLEAILPFKIALFPNPTSAPQQPQGYGGPPPPMDSRSLRCRACPRSGFAFSVLPEGLHFQIAVHFVPIRMNLYGKRAYHVHEEFFY